MTCAVMQPTYLPWIGFFDLIDQSDCFILYDDVQYQKQSWHCRNRVKSNTGELFLTINVRKAPLETLINEIVVDNNTRWFKKHLNSIKMNYAKSPYFKEVFSFLEKFINKDVEKLVDVTVPLIIEISKAIGIDTKVSCSSELEITQDLTKDKRLIEICEKLNCTNYISPLGSATYINEDKLGGNFADNGVKLVYHNYKHPEYPQLHGEFVPYIGIIDLLFNVGFEGALETIRKGRKDLLNYDLIK